MMSLICLFVGGRKNVVSNCKPETSKDCGEIWLIAKKSLKRLHTVSKT